MTWTLGPDFGVSELEHWEASINTIFVPDLPGALYANTNRSRLAPEVMLVVSHTHPLAILGPTFIQLVLRSSFDTGRQIPCR